MSSNDNSVVTFTFNGRIPAEWLNALTQPSTNNSSWINPESPGSLALQAIMSCASSSQPLDIDEVMEITTLSVNLPLQAEILSSFLQLQPAAVTDAKMLLIAGSKITNILSSVTVSTSILLPTGVALSSEHKAERAMYFMTQNGICVFADSTINISPLKLPNAKFFSTAKELESAGIQRWGESGGEGWVVNATVLKNRAVLINGFGHIIYLGDEPEVTICSLSN